MDTNQIYALVNSTAQQAIGETALAVLDTQSLVALGNTILSSSTNTEAFLNSLCQRIGKTIFAYREYRNKFSDFVVDDFEMGAILQKISFKLFQAEEDPSFELTDGQSVDMYEVSKPVVDQKLFVKRTPYMFHVTIARELVKEAFNSVGAMDSFIGYVFGMMRNSIEYSLENLGRLTLANMIMEADKTASRRILLLTEYNAIIGADGEPESPPALTAANALYDEGFLRYAIGRINMISDAFTDMSVEYNDGSIERFTPYADQKIILLNEFNRLAQTQVQYAAFNKNLISVSGAFQTVNYWQSQQSPRNISVKRTSDGVNASKTGVIAVLSDRQAFGVYQTDEDVLTSPVNAAGRYYNTFYHLKRLWFNDVSENFVFFLLA